MGVQISFRECWDCESQRFCSGPFILGSCRSFASFDGIEVSKVKLRQVSASSFPCLEERERYTDLVENAAADVLLRQGLWASGCCLGGISWSLDFGLSGSQLFCKQHPLPFLLANCWSVQSFIETREMSKPAFNVLIFNIMRWWKFLRNGTS